MGRLCLKIFLSFCHYYFYIDKNIIGLWFTLKQMQFLFNMFLYFHMLDDLEIVS